MRPRAWASEGAALALTAILNDAAAPLLLGLRLAQVVDELHATIDRAGREGQRWQPKQLPLGGAPPAKLGRERAQVAGASLQIEIGKLQLRGGAKERDYRRRSTSGESAAHATAAAGRAGGAAQGHMSERRGSFEPMRGKLPSYVSLSAYGDEPEQANGNAAAYPVGGGGTASAATGLRGAAQPMELR